MPRLVHNCRWHRIREGIISFSVSLLLKNFQTYGTHQAGGDDGTHILREALDTVEGYRGETVTLNTGLAIANQTVHPGIHHLHFDGILTGF